MTVINKILIANRGEIAVRIIRTARDLGYRTVAVYSEADTQALHVQLADQAVAIGPASVSESYLSADRIIEAAKKSGADAVHPGYGFLSENADFARRCEQEDIIFIGPSAAAIELMGSKRLSKIAMIEAGVPCISGYQGAEQGDTVLQQKAREIGFPLMVKASAGGGGRGMRLVNHENELQEQIATARSEAQGAFGSGELILEKAVLEPRHIEIQVFADNHGNVVYLGERDCSIQRRHQKVVEEAPSPFVNQALRESMGAAAVEAAKACNYRGAGTVEFLVDQGQQFYFLEMNTRLQVEHPVTELVTGLDLVAWQLRVAAGERLPLAQEQIELRGHAIEVRLYAEDPRDNFMPQTGKIHYLDIPERSGLRVDSGVQQGDIVSPYYDPLLAKVIAFGDSRQEAARRLASAVQDLQLLGINHNKRFLQQVLRHPEFLAGQATTAFISENFSDDPTVSESRPAAITIARAAAVLYCQGLDASASWRSTSTKGFDCQVQWQAAGNKTLDIAVKLRQENDTHFTCSLKISDSAANTSSNGDGDLVSEEVEFLLLDLAENRGVTMVDGLQQPFYYSQNDRMVFIDDGLGHNAFFDVRHQPAQTNVSGGNGQLKAAMDGAIIDVAVAVGDKVERGQTLIVMEAMKMEHPLKAGIEGIVKDINVSAGQQVKTRQLVLLIEPA